MRIALLLALTAIPAATSGPTQDPPSSLRPTRVPGKLRMAHVHRRTTECRDAGTPDQRTCEAATEAARSGTKLTLRPLDADGDADVSRDPVTVQFDNALGRVELSREIEPGIWEIDWDGLRGEHRFWISDGESLQVGLETTTGACVVKKQDCVLDASTVKKSTDIPEGHRTP